VQDWGRETKSNAIDQTRLGGEPALRKGMGSGGACQPVIATTHAFNLVGSADTRLPRHDKHRVSSVGENAAKQKHEANPGEGMMSTESGHRRLDGR